MTRRDRRLFESDRRMELKMRLAASKAAVVPQGSVAALELDGVPDRQILTKLIDRVRRL